jgi:hypothetical protein
VLELVRTTTSVVTAVASPDAIEAAMGTPGTYRVAPDELMAIGASVDDITTSIAGADPDALVVDTTDGWTNWSLRGDAVRPAFSYLSSLELPREGFIQGDVAHVPVRVVVAQDLIQLFVPAMWGAYLRDRLLERCRVLEIREVTEAAP